MCLQTRKNPVRVDRVNVAPPTGLEPEQPILVESFLCRSQTVCYRQEPSRTVKNHQLLFHVYPTLAWERRD